MSPHTPRCRDLRDQEQRVRGPPQARPTAPPHLDVIEHITATGDEVIVHAKLRAVYRTLLDQSQCGRADRTVGVLGLLGPEIGGTNDAGMLSVTAPT
jgi:hypothetical protein